MTEEQAISAICAKLPAAVRDELSTVTVQIKAVPDSVDIARGCDPRQVAYFYGTRPGDDPRASGTMLPDPEGPAGEIVVFRGNLQPFTMARLEAALMHEIAHALGYDEEEIVSIMGYAP